MDASQLLAHIDHLWHDWGMIPCAIPLLIMGCAGELPTPAELLAKATAALGGEDALTTHFQASWKVTKSVKDADGSNNTPPQEEITVNVTRTSYKLKVKRGKGHLTLFHTSEFICCNLW